MYPKTRWYFLAVCCLMYATQSTGLISITPMIDIAAKDLDVPIGKLAGIYLGGYTFVGAVSTLISGFLVDRFGFRPVLFVGMILITVPLSLMSVFGHSLENVMILRFIQGAGSGPVLAFQSAFAATWFPRQHRGMVVGLMGTIFTVGLAYSVNMAPYALTVTGTWQGAIVMVNYVNWIAIILLATCFLLKTPQVPDEHMAEIKEHGGSTRWLWTMPATFAGLGIACFGNICMQGFNDMMPTYFAIPVAAGGIGLGREMSGQLMAMAFAGGLLGPVVCGILIDKVFKSERPALLIAAAIAMVAMYSVWLPQVWGSKILLGSLFLVGMANAFYIPSLASYAAKVFPHHLTGKIIGLWMGLALFGAAGGLGMGGYLFHATGNYHKSILMLSACAAIAFVCSIFLVRPKAGTVSETAEELKPATANT